MIIAVIINFNTNYWKIYLKTFGEKYVKKESPRYSASFRFQSAKVAFRLLSVPHWNFFSLESKWSCIFISSFFLTSWHTLKCLVIMRRICIQDAKI